MLNIIRESDIIGYDGNGKQEWTYRHAISFNVKTGKYFVHEGLDSHGTDEATYEFSTLENAVEKLNALIARGY